MTALTETRGIASITDVAALLVCHVREHGLPEPGTVHINAGYSVLGRGPELRVQAARLDTAGAARELLAWARTVPAVSVAVWRVPDGDSAHVEVTGTLRGGVGTVDLRVFAGMIYDPTVLPTLEPGEKQLVPLGLLHALAALDVDGGEAA